VPSGRFLGLLLGLGLALLLDLVDTSIRTSRDIVRHVHVPILGTVPDLDDEEVPIEKIELAAHTAPRSMVAEAFRTIRTNLLLSSPADRQRTLLVTSSKAEEGKSTVALNLAISIGQSGRRVLLIDANFHQPALHELFPNIRQNGLSNALIGQASLDELVTPTALPNLDVIGCGPIPPNPTELLAGPFLRDLLALAAERYDQIILDGPPVLLVSDALVLTGQVDGVILVCRAKASSRGVIQRAREQIERVNGRIFGAVLNAAQVRRGGYFREQIRNYYDYQPEQALTASGIPALPPSGNGNGATVKNET
jgi:polysaccharide biosynthesis transport protein